jgi:hypothetical protein
VEDNSIGLGLGWAGGAGLDGWTDAGCSERKEMEWPGKKGIRAKIKKEVNLGCRIFLEFESKGKFEIQTKV